MKKIVAIIAASLMLLASCGQTKELTTSRLNENSDLSGNNVSITDKPLWGIDTAKVYISILLSALFFVWGMAKHCCCGNPGAPSADNPVVDPLVVNPNP